MRVPRAQREVATLNSEQAKEVAKLALDFETEMGWPVDLEFSYRVLTVGCTNGP